MLFTWVKLNSANAGALLSAYREPSMENICNEDNIEISQEDYK